MDKKIVPEGMIKAVMGLDFGAEYGDVKYDLEAVLRWLSEIPMEIPMHIAGQMLADYRMGHKGCCDAEAVKFIAEEWQRRMFDAPEPEIPEEIKDLSFSSQCSAMPGPDEVNNHIIEAYRRGKENAK